MDLYICVCDYEGSNLIQNLANDFECGTTPVVVALLKGKDLSSTHFKLLI